MNLEQTLTAWLFRPDPASFPYDAVVEEFHRVGKHFVDTQVLSLLDRARGTLGIGQEQLGNFLDFALDKYDGTLIFVSHDREFVSGLANRIIEVKTDGTLTDFGGNYEDFLSSQGVQ